MVGALSITSLIAGFVAALMGILGLTLPEEQLHGRTCFVLFCTSAGTWAFAHYLILNYAASSGPLAAPYSSSVFWLGATTLLGIGGAPTYWFLFAAAVSGRNRWLRRDRVILAHVPFVYLLVVGLTNPLHDLYVTIDSTTGAARYGPLVVVHLAIVLPLVVVGLFWMTTYWWSRGTATDRHRALTVGITASAALLGGLYYVCGALHGNASNEFAPGLLVLFAVGLAFALFTSRLESGNAEVAVVTPQLSDARIELDRDVRICSLNAVAQRLLPAAMHGQLLGELVPEIARHAEFCINYRCDGLTFETEHEGVALWGRINRSLDASGRPAGCIVVLTELTAMRDTHGASGVVPGPA